jgi:hypothetical protein
MLNTGIEDKIKVSNALWQKKLAISKSKLSLVCINGRLNKAKEKISVLEDITIVTFQVKTV